MTGAPRAIRYFVALSLRVDRRRFLWSTLLVVAGYLATPAVAVLLKAFIGAALDGAGARLLYTALSIGALLIAEIMLQHFAHLTYFELAEKQELVLNERLLDVVNAEVPFRRLDEPDFADGLSLVREDLRKIRTIVTAVLDFGGVLAQTAVTVVILGLLHPALLALPLAALGPVVFGARAQRLQTGAQQAAAGPTRRARHFLRLATSVHAIEELRLFQAQQEVLDRQAATWRTVTRRIGSAHARAALLRAAGNAIFASAYALAIWLVVAQAADGRAATGDVVLVIALAVQVSTQIAGTLSLFSSLQEAGVLAGRLDALTGPAPSSRPPGTGAPPARLAHGIRLERLTYAYPGASAPVLREISLDIPAGATVALVGENGAGKSTLIRLLCGLDRPTGGRILVDGDDLAGLPADAWQRRVAPLFQDFARLELLLRDNVGVGDVDRRDDDAALAAALRYADAAQLSGLVPGGLDGLLGHAYGPGAELSTGQWQRLGLARAAMRPRPLLVVMDEPAAALDANAEYALVERCVSLARTAAADQGTITLFTSHRFTSARRADLAIVLRDGAVAEMGDHDALMRRGGFYAELFTMQARAYA